MNLSTRPPGAVLSVVEIGQKALKTVAVSQPGFSDAMVQALKETSNLQKESGRLTREFTFESPTASLEQTMLAGVKSNLAFQSTLQVRNRVVQAYTDIMNMQI